jgi:cyclophilin family peptidyl-prolyl cis-trans isomerase
MWMLALLLACGDGEDTDVADTDTSGDTDDTDTDTAPQALIVDFETTLGTFAVQLDDENAPITTANFLTYVDEGFYDGDDGLGATVFHRVIPDFVTQGGGQTESGAGKATHDPIVLESQNGLSNARGTIAMARTSVPDSATSQFYVNLVNNGFLDYVSDSEPGYAVFGEVIEGMDTIDAMAAVETDASDEPVTPIVITACERR